MAKEMKTLNGYEIVDQSCRDRVTTLENNTKTISYVSSTSTSPVQSKGISSRIERVRSTYLPGFISNDTDITVYPENSNNANFSFIIMAYNKNYSNNGYIGIVYMTDFPELTLNTMDIKGTYDSYITSIEPSGKSTGGKVVFSAEITTKSDDITVTVLGAYSVSYL